MITKSDSIKNITAALVKFQGLVDGVKRDSDNPFFKSKYADLEKVVDTARPHLQECGIAFLQSPGAIHDNNLSMTTLLSHAESGEWIEGTGDIPLGKKDPQGAGSAQTYAQRYHLMAMLGLPPTDDDGEAAMDRTKPQKAPEKPVKGYNHYLSDITSAKDEPALKAVFAALWRDKSLTDSQKSDLKDGYEDKKRQLSTPSDYIPPSFENINAEMSND